MFQFTHPGRGATTHLQILGSKHHCFNSRTPGGVRRDWYGLSYIFYPVSIHAPREGCDVIHDQRNNNDKVSIHAPRKGCDLLLPLLVKFQPMFQFTHPGRGATRLETEVLKLWMVSIHAPREGCDFSRVRFSVCALEFQFTHPGRGATLMYNTIGYDYDVSIHAPREGCDQKVEPYNGRFGVSIHAPREGCDQVAASLASSSEWFQFTHPGRGATFGEPIKVTSGFRFNSRTPGGVRLSMKRSHRCGSQFQFTHPGRGAT